MPPAKEVRRHYYSSWAPMNWGPLICQVPKGTHRHSCGSLVTFMTASCSSTFEQRIMGWGVASSSQPRWLLCSTVAKVHSEDCLSGGIIASRDCRPWLTCLIPELTGSSSSPVFCAVFCFHVSQRKAARKWFLLRKIMWRLNSQHGGEKIALGLPQTRWEETTDNQIALWPPHTCCACMCTFIHTYTHMYLHAHTHKRKQDMH